MKNSPDFARNHNEHDAKFHNRMNDKKMILVTGGAGFIGSHLCERLTKQGHRVISLDNYFAGSRNNHVAGVEYREGHTKDIETLVPETPDMVYHLGEYSRVEQSLLEPAIVEDLNTIGTRGVLEFWKKRQCKLVYAGSSTKFGDDGTTRTTSPYACTKAENTERVKAIGDAMHLPYAITYFYNVYGPRERSGIYGTVIEIFKEMYRTGSPIAVTSPGTQTRNFTHVLDIVDGLIVVGEKGYGDEYGLGNERSYSILEVATQFGGDVIFLPKRAANRMMSGLDTSKANALGWNPKQSLETYIQNFVLAEARGQKKDTRVLVFSTTFLPTVGPAETALLELMDKMPAVHFDVVTTKFVSGASNIRPTANSDVFRIGFGFRGDKYLLPILGYFEARRLHKKNGYLFAWSLMASYAGLAGVLAKRLLKVPLLITLADQNIADAGPFVRFMLKRILSDADQVYSANADQEQQVFSIAGATVKRSIGGEGDAFANQLRYAYSEILLNQFNAVHSKRA